MRKFLIPLLFLTVGCMQLSEQDKKSMDTVMSQFLELNELDESKAHCKQYMHSKKCFIIYKNDIGEYKKITIECEASGDCSFRGF